MGRLVVSLLAILVLTSVADARTPLGKCRKACKPLVSAICPPQGKALRRCRTSLVRECRRGGLDACALDLPTDGPDDGTTAPTSTTTTTTSPASTSTTVAPPVTTTTLPPPMVPSVAGDWVFEGVLEQVACGRDYDIVRTLVVNLAVQQEGETLFGAIEDDAADGAVDGEGWTFSWSKEGTTCAKHFTVYASGYSSPAEARATATENCGDGFTCQARWIGSLTLVP